MKVKRELSGIYFRSKNEETGKWDNICFEDMSIEEQDKQMKEKDEEWLRSLAKQLSNTLNHIGDKFDIVVKEE